MARNSKKGGIRAPKNSDDAVAMALDYVRGLASASDPLVNYYNRAAGRVPTGKEITREIGDIYGGLQGQITTGSDALMQGAASFAEAAGLDPSYAVSAATSAREAEQALLRAIGLDQSKAETSAKSQANAKRESFLERSAAARSERSKTRADWLPVLSSLLGLVPQSSGYGSGSAATTLNPDTVNYGKLFDDPSDAVTVNRGGNLFTYTPGASVATGGQGAFYPGGTSTGYNTGIYNRGVRPPSNRGYGPWSNR